MAYTRKKNKTNKRQYGGTNVQRRLNILNQRRKRQEGQTRKAGTLNSPDSLVGLTQEIYQNLGNKKVFIYNKNTFELNEDGKLAKRYFKARYYTNTNSFVVQPHRNQSTVGTMELGPSNVTAYSMDNIGNYIQDNINRVRITIQAENFSSYKVQSVVLDANDYSINYKDGSETKTVKLYDIYSFIVSDEQENEVFKSDCGAVERQYGNILEKAKEMITSIKQGDAVTVTKNETQKELLVLDNTHTQSLSKELSNALEAFGSIEGGRKTKKMLKNKRKGGKTSKRGLAKKKKNQSKRKKK